MRFFSFITIGCFFLAGSLSIAETAPSTEKADITLTCSGGAGERKLVIAGKDKGCELQYTKNDKMDVIATQKIGKSFCEEKLEKVKGKLEAAGYKCAE